MNIENIRKDPKRIEVEAIMKYWPDKIPVIMRKEEKSKMQTLEKPKFLCPKEFSVLQFLVYLRKKTNLPKKSALFVFAKKGEILSGDKMMIDVYQRCAADDGFLYLTYGEHAAYG